VKPAKRVRKPELLSRADLLAWYKGPLTKTRISKLRYKLARARGLLISFIGWEEDRLRSSRELLPTTEEVKLILKETEDP
jgi:hypothetical protein